MGPLGLLSAWPGNMPCDCLMSPGLPGEPGRYEEPQLGGGKNCLSASNTVKWIALGWSDLVLVGRALGSTYSRPPLSSGLPPSAQTCQELRSRLPGTAVQVMRGCTRAHALLPTLGDLAWGQFLWEEGCLSSQRHGLKPFYNSSTHRGRLSYLARLTVGH